MQVPNRLINGIELPVAQVQSLGFGQLECLPYPTLAQGYARLKDMPGEKQNPVTDMNEARAARVRIVPIAFVGGDNLSPSLRDKLTRQVRSHGYHDDPRLDWRSEIQDVEVRGSCKTRATFERRQFSKCIE
jgi:hypothetical protein